MTPSRAICARWPAVPQPKSGALPVAAAARTLVTYCSSGTNSMLIWTPLSLWASLKFSIILAQTSPSEAASQLQWTISVVCWACGARPVSQKGVLAAAAPAVNARRVICQRVVIRTSACWTGPPCA